MKKRLLDLLCCPDCGHPTLELLAYRTDDDGGGQQVVEGELRCGPCGSRFPVINGIPRMLPAGLRPSLVRFHRDFFALHPHLVSGPGSADERVVQTLEGFSYQHLKLRDGARETERWRKNFLSSIPIGEAFFGGKLGVDIGCGSGRHVYWAHEFGAEVVGVDLSEGVEVAAATTAGCPRVHIVQGDVDHLPFKPGVFDFAYSLGVIHHLPRPREGFQRIVRAVRPGGTLFIWVYGLQGMRRWYRLSHMTWLRGITPRLPRWAQSILSAALAALLEVLLWRPCRLASRLPGGPALVERIPLGDACRRPFRAKIRSVFDRIQPPVTTYHTAEELAGWFHDAKLTEVAVTNRDGRGWIATGVRQSGT